MEQKPLDQNSDTAAEPQPGAGFTLPELGRRLRGLRQRRRMTLQQLSEASDMSIGMLSQIERGVSSPSIRTLQRLADAFSVPIGLFFSAGQESASPSWVLRRASRQVLNLSGKGITKELLTPFGDGTLELLVVTVEPGGSSGLQPYSHEGEDAGVVTEGTLQLEVAGESALLGPGDAFRFPSRLPHRFDNPGTVRACVIWAITPPFY